MGRCPPHQAPALHALAHADALQCREVDESSFSGRGTRPVPDRSSSCREPRPGEHLRPCPLEPGVAGQVQDLQALQPRGSRGRQPGETLQVAQRQVSEARQPSKVPGPMAASGFPSRLR